MKALKRVLTVIACAAAAVVALGAHAQQYPSRAVRLIVPFPPGGPTDVVARIVAQHLTERLGQQVIVDNRGGASGNIGMGIAAQASPDGHTVLFVSSSFVINPGLYKRIPYDPHKSFAPVSQITTTPLAFFSHPSQPVKSVPELVELVKKTPGKHSMAIPGIGTILSAHLLRLDAKLDIVLVPFAGASPSLAAVLGNQVPFGCQALPPLTPHFKAGRLRPLALTSAQRAPALPDVPTMAEIGYRGHVEYSMSGMLLPAGTPKTIVNQLHKEVARIMALPEVRERIADMGFNIIVNSPQEFAAQIKDEVARSGKVVKAAGIQVD
jgi:tripartite-type tricarboxylate transporter receptor subunit TctC